jgi:tRNA A-37 threonylcarbamoyl transferase component Bud32
VNELYDQLQATLGHAYRLERELGGGGMSRVFLAHESGLGRKVVIKVLLPELAAGVSVERFRREIQLAAQLQHPHIVPLHAAGESNGLPYFTMPYIAGESLRAKIAREGELPVNETVRILRDVVAALAYAHGHGVMHRDIKPDNVLLSGGVAVVTDFGVAKALRDSGDLAHTALTSMGLALGTPAYMAPEQATGDPQTDHRADIYALGVMAYEMLTGRAPFAGRSPQATLAAHAVEMPEPIERLRPATPPALAALVMQCLAKRPADRPQSANEVQNVLDALGTPTGGIAPTPLQVTTVLSPERTQRRVPGALLSAFAAGVIVVGGGGAAVWLARSRAHVEPQPATAAESPAAAAPPAAAPAPRPEQPSAAPRADAPAVGPDRSDPDPASARATRPAHAERAAPPRGRAPGQPKPAQATRRADETAAVPPSAESSVSRIGPDAATPSAPAPAGSPTAPVTPAERPGAAPGPAPSPAALPAAPRESAATTAPPAGTSPTLAPAAGGAPSAAPSAPPPPHAAPPPPAPAPAADARSDIRTTVARYADAINSRDVANIRRVYPAMSAAQQRAWEQFFGTVRDVRAELSLAQLKLGDGTAEAQITGTYTYMNVSTGSRETQPVGFHASFRRDAAGWLISAVR